MSIAPILLFTYKRITPLKDTLNALKANFLSGESELYIYSDGPKNSDDKKHVDEVRNYLKSVDGFKKITIKNAEENKGLARSIIEGTTEIIRQFGKVIVLEDDLLTTPNFLNYMNEALDRYQSEKKVFSISAYSFDFGSNPIHPENYFLNRGWSWGWATWGDRWNLVDWEVKAYPLFKDDRRERKLFAKGGSDLNTMLDKQMKGALDSWAIRWFFNQFKFGGLTLYPKFSKVYNNGFDQFATHTNGSSKRYIPILDNEHMISFEFPREISLNEHYQKAFALKMGIRSRIVSKVETLIKRYIS
jgi:hypothetical protein